MSGFIYWPNGRTRETGNHLAGHGLFAGATKEAAIAYVRTNEQHKRPSVGQLTEHDTSKHAIGQKTDETFIREIDWRPSCGN